MTGEADIGVQIAAFVQAPIPYIFEALFVAGITWTASRTISRDTMIALRERLNLATDRLRKASEEAENFRRRLAAAQNLRKTRALRPQTVTFPEAAEVKLIEIQCANRKAPGVIRQPSRQRFFMPGGMRPMAPAAANGRASRPQVIR